MDDEQYGDLLRVTRKSQGWSQRELAEAVGYSERQIRSFEKGAHVSQALRAKFRTYLGEFDVTGDPVEIAIDKSELIQWRKSDLKTAYQRHLFEQAEAERRSG